MEDLFRNLEFKVHSLDFEKSTTKDGRRLIKGYSSTSDLDRQNEIISRKALEGARNDLLENVTVFMDHQHTALPVGKVIDCILDDKGLFITVELSKAKFVDDIWQLCLEKILNSFSIGGVVLDGHDERGDDGKSYHVIDKISILEVSICGLPANPEARFEPIYKSFNSAIAEQIKQKEGKSKMAEQNKQEVTKTEEPQKEAVKVEEPKKDEAASEKVSEETKKDEAKVEEKVEKPKIEVDVSLVGEAEKVEEATTVESKDVVEPEKKEEKVEDKVEDKPALEAPEKKEEEKVEDSEESKEDETESDEQAEEAKLEATEVADNSEAIAEASEEAASDVAEEEASDEIVEKSQETSPEKTEENEEAKVEEEESTEKSTEEKILDALALIIEKLSALDKKEIEEKKEEPKEEKVEDQETKEKQEEYVCECLACGEVVTTSEHCRDIKCTKCGGEMRRQERPGVGKEADTTEEKKVEKKVEKKEEEPTRKSMAVIVPSPYEEESKPEEVKKTSNEGWKQVFFGK